MQELKKYIESNKVTNSRLNTGVRDANLLPYPKRNIFYTLSRYACDFITEKSEPRLISISGLRGVGKTTVMWQTAEVIFKQVSDIFFLNGSELKSLNYNLYTVFQLIEDEIIKKPFYELTSPIVFLISEILFRLLMRLALSDEINYQSLSRDFGNKEKIEHFINLLDKAEVLNIFLLYGGIKTKTGKNIKPFFMSPSLRRALYTRIYGGELNNNLQAKLYEDIVAMYLRKNFDKGLVSFGISKNGVSPDFIIETHNKPVVLELEINKKKHKTSIQIQRKQTLRNYNKCKN